MIKALKKVKLFPAVRLQSYEESDNWCICIDDGYCSYKFSINKNPITGQYSVQTLANAIERVCRTAPKEVATGTDYYVELP